MLARIIYVCQCEIVLFVCLASGLNRHCVGETRRAPDQFRGFRGGYGTHPLILATIEWVNARLRACALCVSVCYDCAQARIIIYMYWRCVECERFARSVSLYCLHVRCRG